MSITKIAKTLFEYQTDNEGGRPSLNILPCLKQICFLLKKNGIDCQLQKYQVLSERGNSLTHANLIALNPKLKGPFILLQGHIDTVPFMLPYNININSKTIKGRGAVDMKGSLAGMIAAFINLSKKANSLKYPSALLITGDEEANNFAGIKTFLKNKKPPVYFAINGEPTKFKMGLNLLGVLGYKLEKKGRGGHSASIFNDHLLDKTIPLLNSIKSFLTQAREISDKDFGRTIAAFSVLNAGGKANLLPESFKICFNLRIVKPKEIYNKIFKETIEKQLDKKTKVKSFSYDPVKVFLSLHIRKAVKDAFASVKIKYQESNVRVFTEASLLNQKDIPTIVCGPGDPELAHLRSEKEVIKIKDILQYSQLLQNIVEKINEE